VLLAAAACALAGPSTAAAAAGWGITLDGTTAGNPPLFPYQANPYLTELLGGPSCHDPGSTALCYANIYVAWDAINNGRGSFAGGTCTRSPSGPGTPAQAFLDQVSAAGRMVGVGNVMVTITTAPPGSPDDIWPTDSGYECGLSGLERAAPGVTEWEVFNEPDSEYGPDSNPDGEADCTRRNGVFVSESSQCAFGSPATNPPGGNGHGGSAQGAAYWYLDAKRADPNPRHTLIAGGFNYSSSRCTTTTCYYLRGYMSNLSRDYHHPPDAVALHPYIDVDYAALNGGDPVPPSSSGLPSTQAAIDVTDQTLHSDPPIWFTESGVWISDAGKEPVTSSCGDGSPQDDGTWLSCLDGNPTAQALAAEGYLRLPSESPQVQRIYYYDFNGQNEGWDSGLVNVNTPLLGSHGYGTPRTTWCVLRDFELGQSPSTAAANAVVPGSRCDDQDRGDPAYAPIVDAAYLHAPLPASANVPPGQSGVAVATPGAVDAAVALIVADGVRTVIGLVQQ
jgi:hypothetical protein